MLLPGRAILLVALALFAGMAAAQEQAVFEDPSTGVVFLSGGELAYSGAVDDDVFAAGFRLNLTELQALDIFAAGFDLVLRDVAAEDVVVAGYSISLAGDIADDVIAAGNELTLSEGASLGGGAILAGETVTVRGRIGRGLRIAANRAVIDGIIDGDVVVEAAQVRIGPQARIAGVLRHASLELDIDVAAQVAEIEGGPLPERFEQAPDMDAPERPPAGPLLAAAAALGSLFFLLGQFALAALLYLLIPELFHAAAQRLALGVLAPLGLGVAVLIATPVLALMIAATVIGGLVGLYVLGSYLLLLAPGGCVIALALAQMLRRRLRPDAGWPPSRGTGVGLIAGGMLALWLIGLLPLLGALVGFLATAAGTGALLLTLRKMIFARRMAAI